MPRRFYFLLTLATLLGAFLRLWQLTLVPPGLHYDLAATALLGNDVAFNGYRPIFRPTPGTKFFSITGSRCGSGSTNQGGCTTESRALPCQDAASPNRAK